LFVLFLRCHSDRQAALQVFLLLRLTQPIVASQIAQFQNTRGSTLHFRVEPRI